MVVNSPQIGSSVQISLLKFRRYNQFTLPLPVWHFHTSDLLHPWSDLLFPQPALTQLGWQISLIWSSPNPWSHPWLTSFLPHIQIHQGIQSWWLSLQRICRIEPLLHVASATSLTWATIVSQLDHSTVCPLVPLGLHSATSWSILNRADTLTLLHCKSHYIRLLFKALE